MRVPILALALVTVVVTGCAAPTRVVAPTDDLAEVRRQVNGRSAEVRLRDGRSYGVYSLQIDRDTTSWVDAGTHGLVRVPTAAIAEVRQTDRPRSARRGAGAGLLVGGLVGGVVGGAVGHEFADLCFYGPCPEPNYVAATAAGAAAGALMGAGAGGLWGLVVGAVAARPTRWVFEGRPVESASTRPPRPNPDP